jgi:hypothetical protein
MVLPYSPSPPMQPPGAMMPVPAGLMGSPGAPPAGLPDQIVDADFRVLVSAAEANIAPPPPPWYIPTSKPDPKDIEAEAHEQKEIHASRVRNQAWMEMRLGMEISSIFANDEMWVNLKEIEPQASPILRRIHDEVINFIASQTVQFVSLAQGIVNREERAAIENSLIDSYRDWKETTLREGQGSLTRVLTADALAGMVAIYHAPDPGNERSGQRRYRVDPKVVYPIFGRDGLDRVYTVYDATYPEVLRDFGDGPGGDATKAIQEIARKGGGRGKRTFDMTTAHELIGYWDREYGVVLWKGMVIRQWHHKLWVCPWHVFVPNWRNQMGTKTSSTYAWGGDRSGTRIDPDGISTGEMGRSTRQMEMARAYEHFLMPWLAVADKFEKGQTRYAYGVDRALSQPRVWKRSSANSKMGTPEIQNFRDGTTEIEEDEELDVLPMNPLNESFAPWWEMVLMEMKMVIPVNILQGQTIGTQATGNALDAIHELGYSIFSPVVEFMPMVLQEVAHRELVYKRDWAKTYDPDDPQGGFAVPSREGYRRPPVKLTKEMLERAGCYVDCSMSRFSLSGLTAAVTTATQIDQTLHIGTRPFWMEKLGISPNPLALEDARRDQDMEDAPGYVEARQVEHLYEQMEQAAQLDDQESLRRISSRAKRVVAKQTAHDMALAKMSGMLPPQPEAMPGELPEGTGSGAPGTNPMPYLSAPEVGRETGTEGGAPTVAQPPIPGMG